MANESGHDIGALKLYTIPPGISFADCLALGILERNRQNPTPLPDWRVFLPTRRGCRTLRDSFLKMSEGSALLLPRLNPLGDVDETELAFSDIVLEADTVPPAIGSLLRQTLLARMIAQLPDLSLNLSFAQNFQLAGSLARFLDQTHTEGLDLAKLQDLVPTNLNEHWKLALAFLQPLSNIWPDLLQSYSAIDPAQRRHILTELLIKEWQNNPPQTPIIAAGSTGTIPATSNLLKLIAQLPQGEVILPGLDLDLDETSWQNVREGHPQFTLKLLLDKMGVSRADVKLWPWTKPELLSQTATARAQLWREVMRPSETAAHWHMLNETSIDQTATENMQLVETETQEEEALVIALALRKAIEETEHDATLITPDRALGLRVKTILSRWNIAADDTGGVALSKTLPGQFMLRLINCCQNNLRALSFIDFLQHKYVEITDYDLDAFRRTLEKANILRGAAKETPQALRAIIEKDRPEQLACFDTVLTSFNPLLDIAEGEHATAQYVEALLQTAENFAAAETLWAGQDGEALAKLLRDLQEATQALPNMSLSGFADLLTQLIASQNVRYPTPPGARINILGQLEARLLQAGFVVLGSLNEGVWPAESAADPWMSRPMRAEFGLPSPERSITLSAHDFVQAASAGNVLLTRSLRAGEDHTIASRWLQRMDAVIENAKLTHPREAGYELLALARTLDKALVTRSIEAPAPTPPLAARPTTMSLTDVQWWVKDPYAFYAKTCLRLRPLRPIEEDTDARLQGIKLHEILNRFIEETSIKWPQNPAALFREIAAQCGAPEGSDEANRLLWGNFTDHLADIIAAEETKRREAGSVPLKVEIDGVLEIAGLTIKARADRIDRTADGRAEILDYKMSSSSYAVKDVLRGFLPQLPLEALCLEQGGFNDLPRMDIEAISYWKLPQKSPNTTPEPLGGKKTPVEDILAVGRNGIEELSATYLQNVAQPYLSQPFGKDFANKDYLHLARSAEWSLSGDTEEDEAA